MRPTVLLLLALLPLVMSSGYGRHPPDLSEAGRDRVSDIYNAIEDLELELDELNHQRCILDQQEQLVRIKLIKLQKKLRTPSLPPHQPLNIGHEREEEAHEWILNRFPAPPPRQPLHLRHDSDAGAHDRTPRRYISPPPPRPPPELPPPELPHFKLPKKNRNEAQPSFYKNQKAAASEAFVAKSPKKWLNILKKKPSTGSFRG
jgi:hypothetical protein